MDAFISDEKENLKIDIVRKSRAANGYSSDSRRAGRGRRFDDHDEQDSRSAGSDGKIPRGDCPQQPTHGEFLLSVELFI